MIYYPPSVEQLGQLHNMYKHMDMDMHTSMYMGMYVHGHGYMHMSETATHYVKSTSMQKTPGRPKCRW